MATNKRFFKYKKVPKGISYRLREEEARSLMEMLTEYVVGILTYAKSPVPERIREYLVTEVLRRMNVATAGLLKDHVNVTLSHAEALALYEAITQQDIVAANLYDKVTLQNIFSSIDKTLV